MERRSDGEGDEDGGMGRDYKMQKSMAGEREGGEWQRGGNHVDMWGTMVTALNPFAPFLCFLYSPHLQLLLPPQPAVMLAAELAAAVDGEMVVKD